MASLPADRTKLALAQGNQVPNLVLASAKNINAIIEAYDTIDLLNQKVDTNYGTGAIGTNQLATDSVTLAKMADNSVGTAELVAASVTLAKMAAASVGTSQLVDGSVTDVKIASGTITADKFVAGALNNDTQNGLNIVAIQTDNVQRAINVCSAPYNAVGDGVHDDTNAIELALEHALGLVAGTWETGGDTVAAYSRKSIPVFFPKGTYRTTRPIPVNYMKVKLVGLVDASCGSSGSVISADHTGDIFALNTNYFVYDFSLKNMSLTKSTAHANTGNGVSLTGSNWSMGLYVENSSITGCNNGISINYSSGNATFADLFVTKSTIGNNAGYGIYSTKNITIGEISKNLITQNGTGGIYTGSYGLTICNNDLEGQPSPLTIIHPTAPCKSITIFGNYFEYHLSGVGCIALYNTRKFKIFNNYYSTNNVNIPAVYLSSCSFGEMDDTSGINVIFYNVLNVKRIGSVALTGFETFDVINFSNKSCYVPSSYALTSSAPDSNFDYNGKRYTTNLLTGLARFINRFTKTYNVNDYVFYSYAVKYTGDIPGSAYGFRPPSVLPQGVRTSDGVTETLTIIGSNISSFSDIQVGDIYINTVCLQITTAYTKMNFYAYPFGNQTTDLGNGAYLVAGLVWTQSTNVIPNINPLEILGEAFTTTASTLPTASSAYAGIIYTVPGASGVADVTYICRKKTDNTYEWKALYV